MRTELCRMLAKSDRTLSAAQAAMRDGFVETAASRAYYAVFHAIQALLKSMDRTYSKHAGVIAAFHREFIRTGIFPREFGRALTRLVKHRDIGDYSYVWELGPEEIEEDIRDAQGIIEAARRYLNLETNCEQSNMDDPQR